MRKSLMALPVASVIALVTCLSATEAQAGLETITKMRSDDQNCQYPHESNPFALWRPADGRFIVSGTGKGWIEVYGHYIDWSDRASLPGIGGVSARLAGTRGGQINGPAHCGVVGSAIVELTLADVGSDRQSTLTIGGETIPVTVTPSVVKYLKWAHSNYANGWDDRTSAAPDMPESRAPHGGECVGVTPGTSCMVLANTGGGQSGPSPNDHTLSRCADAHNLGLKGELLSDGSLELTLPARRTGEMATCFARHLLVEYDIRGKNADLHVGNSAPTLSITATNGLPVTILQQSDARDSYGLVNVDPTFLQNFVGFQTFDLTVSPGSESSKLKLSLFSNPSYGPKALSAPLYPSTVGRMSSDITLKVTTYHPATAGQTFTWGLSSNEVVASTCFETTSGTLTAPVGGTQIDLPLKVKETPACYSKSFKVTVKTTGLPADVIDAPFVRSVGFTLRSLNLPQNIAAKGPTIQSNITRP